jgi:fucose permease
LYYLPVYFEGVRGYSIASTGLAFLPVTGAMIVGSLGSGSLIHNTARLRWIIIAGWTLALVSTGMLFVFNRTTQTYKWVLILLLVGLGHGTLIVSLNYALQVLAEGRQVAHAMSMYTFLRSFGMCLGVAAGSSLLQNALRSQSSQSSSATALMDVMNLATHPELPPALLISFRYTCAVMTGVAIAGLVLSFVYAVSSSDVRNR